MFSRKRLLLPSAILFGLVAVVVSGCTPAVALDPAADATNPGCAEIMVRLPESVASIDLRQTNAQATAAWGIPASVLLRCGVTPYGPTTLPCNTILGIDWIEDDSNKPSYTFTTFGRVPATQVIVDSNAVSASTVLADLQTAVASIPQTSICTDANNVLGSGTASGAPTDPASTGTPADPGSPAPSSSDTGTPAPAPFIIETPTPAGN